VIGAALPLLAAALLQPAIGAERRYAVVVGANLGGPDQEPLRFAERDAERTAAVLRDLAGVHQEDLVLLLAPDAASLERVLARTAQRVAAETAEGDRTLLFVYYSGHADERGLRLGPSAFALDALREQVEAMPVDVRVLLVDACRSGEILRSKGATPVEPFAITIRGPEQSEGLAILTSASGEEDAQESDRLQSGVFTHHLLAGLQGAADTSADHKVSLSEAYQYAYDRTLMTTSRAPTLQHPSYVFDLRGQRDLVLTELESGNGTGQLELSEAGQYVFFDPKGSDLVVEAEVAEAGTLALPAGSYLVRRRLPAEVYQGEVVIEAGGRTVLEPSSLALMPYGHTARRGTAAQRHSATALSLGGGMAGTPSSGFGLGPAAGLGLRVDTHAATFGLGLRYAQHGAENDILAIDQRSFGLDLGAYRHIDLRSFSPGLGVRAGSDLIWQRFSTEGEAPAHTGLSGRAGPALRLDWAMAPRWLLGLELGADINLFMGVDPVDGASTLRTAATPYVSLQLSRYLF
jgi:hypothetical protein